MTDCNLSCDYSVGFSFPDFHPRKTFKNAILFHRKSLYGAVWMRGISLTVVYHRHVVYTVTSLVANRRFARRVKATDTWHVAMAPSVRVGRGDGESHRGARGKAHQ